jgi:hypothetical protein
MSYQLSAKSYQLSAISFQLRFVVYLPGSTARHLLCY